MLGVSAMCRDKSLDYLRGLGYNVIRHPNAAVKPLQLIGRQGGETQLLGGLEKLITNPGSLPNVQENTVATDIVGRSSSKLNVAIGANILGSLIGGFGGNLGTRISYTTAEKVEFHYTNVLNDTALPLDIGNYLRSARIDAGNPVLEQYVLGYGELFVITKTAKSKKFKVSYERANGTSAKVDLPELQALAGADVKVELASNSKHEINFAGQVNLVFGFQCFRVGVLDGDLTLTAVKAGGVVYAVGAPGDKGEVILNHEGFVRLLN
jgi:hypothetical protein